MGAPAPPLEDLRAADRPAPSARERPRLALVGNPNTGKTSLFNRLCGVRAKTANFPGTTTDLRVGRAQLGTEEEALPAEVLDTHRALHRYRRDLPWTDATFLGAARSILKLLLRRPRFEEHLRRVRAPTLLMHGTRDRLVSIVNARAVARRREDFTFAELPTQGHTPMLEEPAEFVERVLGWTATIAPPARPAAAP